MKQNDLIKNIENIDLRKCGVHEMILERELSAGELQKVLVRIKQQLQMPCAPQISMMLKMFRKQLKSKYSIELSNNIIHKFMKTTSCKLFNKPDLEFNAIDKEIKTTVQEIQRKKYFMVKTSQNQLKKKPSSEKRKRRNVLYSAVSIMPHVKSNTNLDYELVRDKLFILKEYISENEMQQLQITLLNKIQAINSQKYGNFAENIKNYTIYDAVLQKIFNLIQENTKNIEIRHRYQQIYKKMKQEMVSIVTNEEKVNSLLRKMQRKSSKPISQGHSKNKQLPKKNYYQIDKDKQDLTTQIEETIETAKKAIKQALIKRQRPDYAYEMELSMENRRTPCIRSRVAL